MTVRSWMILSVCLVFFGCGTSQKEATPKPPKDRAASAGLSPTIARLYGSVESSLRDEIRTTRIEATLKRLTKRARTAGSAGGLESAEAVRGMMVLAGLDARIDTYEVLLPYPGNETVELLSPAAFRPSRTAVGVDTDLGTHDPTAMAPFMAYSPEAEVTGPLVYANRCRIEDLEVLGRTVRLRGAIVIARFGGPPPAIKALNAWNAGAVGLIVYPDPNDDGYRVGDVYPKGPWRPASSARRGTVLHPQFAGDPLTPGVAATTGARRIPIDQVRGVSPIPVVTLSSKDAHPFLESLAGATVPSAWQGGLPFTYHLGDGEATIARVGTTSDWRMRRIFNVVGTLRGSAFPDERVLVGAARDAWIVGAGQTGTATAALIEAATALSTLAKSGRPPSRTLVFCSFDGQQFGRIGSVEHFESEENLRGVVAMLDIGPALGPRLDLRADPLLTAALTSAFAHDGDAAPSMTSVTDPVSNPEHDREPKAFETFLYGAGIPSVSLSATAIEGGTHSVFDTFGWVRRYGDPRYERTSDLARRAAALAWSMGTATILPYDIQAIPAAVAARLSSLDLTTLDTLTHPDARPAAEHQAPPSLRSTLESAVLDLASEATRFDSLRTEILARDPDPTRLVAVNQRLLLLTQIPLTPGQGLWRHRLLGPLDESPGQSRWLPALTDALASGNDPLPAALELVAMLTDIRSGLLRLNIGLEASLAAPQTQQP